MKTDWKSLQNALERLQKLINRAETMYCRHFCIRILLKCCTVGIFAPGLCKNVVLSVFSRQVRAKTLYCRHFCIWLMQNRCTVGVFGAGTVQKRCTVGILASGPLKNLIFAAEKWARQELQKRNVFNTFLIRFLYVFNSLLARPNFQDKKLVERTGQKSEKIIVFNAFSIRF